MHVLLLEEEAMAGKTNPSSGGDVWVVWAILLGMVLLQPWLLSAVGFASAEGMPCCGALGLLLFVDTLLAIVSPSPFVSKSKPVVLKDPSRSLPTNYE